jgi:S-methyl-5-thioribose-1-phosphate isomerase
MKVDGKHYRSVWMKAGLVYGIDQQKLPYEFSLFTLSDHHQCCEALESMLVRGAGTIGSMAAYAMVLAFIEAPNSEIEEYVTKAKHKIESTRPTAQSLFYSTNRVFEHAILSKDHSKAALREAELIAQEDVDACKQIGEFGFELIKDNFGILTHCNAGWLATTDYGTALSPIYLANRRKSNLFVFVDETRPRCQGSKLTAWELNNEKVPHSIIADNAAAQLMSEGKIDILITGADRIAANGDVANKIGTLQKAICANHFDIPFYVAAPTSVIDFACESGTKIPIETREEEELTKIDCYWQKKHIRADFASPGSPAYNPAFDVTPANLITGIITEKGIFKPKELKQLCFTKV